MKFIQQRTERRVLPKLTLAVSMLVLSSSVIAQDVVVNNTAIIDGVRVVLKPTAPPPPPPPPKKLTEEELAEIAKRDAAKAEELRRIAAEKAAKDQLAKDLFDAVESGDYARAKNAIDRKAIATPELVQLAIDGGYTGIAFLLMRSGAEVPPRMLGKALIAAVNNQDRTRVTNLIKLGANPNHVEGEVTPLRAAARNDDMGLLGVLLQSGADRDPKALGMALVHAVKQQNKDKASNLLRMGANPNATDKQGNSLVDLALNLSDFGMAGVLIQAGARPDRKALGNSLVRAVDAGNADQALMLIKLGADVNYSVSGRSPLIMALDSQDFGMASKLIEAGAQEPTVRYGKQLYEAALEGDGGLVNILSRLENYRNYANDAGETPLHAAASTGQVDIIQTLLRAGVDPNIRTVKNWTPLHHASRFGHKLATIHLLKSGADAYALNSDGYDAKKLAVIALNDSENDIDSRGVIEYLHLWSTYNPRPIE